MSQYDFGTIDPNTKSGTALATDLNSWRTALHTIHSGTSAPSYITAGMLWLDTTDANYILKMYDGAQSIPVARIDATNDVARVALDNDGNSYLSSPTNNEISAWIDGTKTATVKSTGLKFEIAAPTVQDINGNTALEFNAVGSAVNYARVTNAVTAFAPTISAQGSDTNVDLQLYAKGDSEVRIGTITATVTNSVHDAAYVRMETTGTPANGIGTALVFQTETTAGVRNGVHLSAIANDVTSSSEDFDFKIGLMVNGTANQEAVSFTSSRYMRLGSDALGIQFHGDTAAANALNDYEEGTWTPVVEGLTTAGVGTYSAQVGRYTKVGRLVTVACEVTITAHTGTGNMAISGLPFAAVNGGVMYPFMIAYSNLTVPASSIAFGYVQDNTSTVRIASIATAGATFAALALDVANTIRFSVTYEAA